MDSLEARYRDFHDKEKEIQDMFNETENRFLCARCGKAYKKRGHFEQHLLKKHNWQPYQEQIHAGEADRVAQYRASFMKCALLLRDTGDAYRMGDGDRIMDNAKFQMLLSGISHHTKYQLWLFRFLAYYHCLLDSKDAFEYKWNCTANLQGGTGHNIPNDNLVEMLVHRLKEKVQTQGANVSHASVRRAALCLQTQDAIKENLRNECKLKKCGTNRPQTSVVNDIVIMVNELKAENVFGFVPGRRYENFRTFSDLFSRIKLMELHKWLTKQKERLYYETV